MSLLRYVYLSSLYDHSAFSRVRHRVVAGYSPSEQELLDKLEKTEERLAQTELDLGSEQNVRRTLQAEIAETTRTMQAQIDESKAKEEALVQQQAKRPFVIVLIDADAEGFLVHSPLSIPPKNIWSQVCNVIYCIVPRQVHHSQSPRRRISRRRTQPPDPRIPTRTL